MQSEWFWRVLRDNSLAPKVKWAIWSWWTDHVHTQCCYCKQANDWEECRSQLPANVWCRLCTRLCCIMRGNTGTIHSTGSNNGLTPVPHYYGYIKRNDPCCILLLCQTYLKSPLTIEYRRTILCKENVTSLYTDTAGNYITLQCITWAHIQS